MKEVTVENYLVEQVELRGGLCEKHVAPGRKGVPDRLITWWGCMDVVETKAPGKKPRKDQERDHLRRAARGVYVHVLDTREAVDEYIASRRTVWLREPGSSLTRTGIQWSESRCNIGVNADELE